MHRGLMREATLAAYRSDPAPESSSTTTTGLHFRSPWQVIVGAGLVVGAMDGLENAIFNYAYRGIAPIRMFHYIASGLLGVKAFRGGWPTAILGLGLHLLIATSAAAVYYFLSRKVKAMRDRPFLCGTVFGLAIFAFMQFVIIPLCSAPKQPPHSLAWLINLTSAHILCIGVPIAWLTRRWAGDSQQLAAIRLSEKSPA